MSVAQVDPAGEFMRDHVRGDCRSITVSVQHDRPALAFFDHVTGDYRSVRVFDHDAVTQMIVKIVPAHRQVE